MKDRTPITQTLEWKARTRLGEVIASRQHLESMVHVWKEKLEEVQAHLLTAQRNLERVKLEESTLRNHDIPQAVVMDKTSRRIELLAAMEKTREELAKLEASEI